MPRGLIFPVPASAVFDPGTLALTGWWRANFAASPWTGTASAGISGTKNLSEATNPPATGATINGLTPASFDGVNDSLTAASSTVDTFYNAASYSGWALIKITSISTNIASPSLYDNDSVVAGSAFAGIVLRSTPTVSIFHFDSTQKSAAATISTGAWQLVQWRYDGTNIKIRVNSGSYSSTAAASLSDLTGAFTLVKDYSGAAHYTGLIAEVGVSDVAFSDATDDNIKSYINSRYALSL